MLAFEARAPLEAMLGVASAPLLARAPKGDGHPVLVIPPFGAADHFTAGLRIFLRTRGYEVHGWGHSDMIGLQALLGAAVERVREVRELAAGKQVSLVGHNVGGTYACEVARYTPHDVRCVVTLGCPSSNPKANHMWPMLEAAAGAQATMSEEFVQNMATAPPVPTTSIYSPGDGVVSWRSCIDPSPGQVENVEVPASHCGLPFNPWALFVVADRLAQPEGNWEPFKRKGLRSILFSRGPTSRGAADADVKLP